MHEYGQRTEKEQEKKTYSLDISDVRKKRDNLLVWEILANNHHLIFEIFSCFLSQKLTKTVPSQGK